MYLARDFHLWSPGHGSEVRSFLMQAAMWGATFEKDLSSLSDRIATTNWECPNVCGASTRNANAPFLLYQMRLATFLRNSLKARAIDPTFAEMIFISSGLTMFIQSV